MLIITIIAAIFVPALIVVSVSVINHEAAEIKYLLKAPLIQAKKGFVNILYIYILPPVFYILFYILKMPESMDLYIIQSFILIFFTAVIAAVDFEYKKIPNIILICMLAAWALTVIPQLALDFDAGFSQLIDSGLGLLLGGGFFLLCYIISRRNIGGGDVKLMAVIGLYITVYKILSVMFYGMLAAALTGVILILLKKLSKKDSMPLSPFLFLGVFTALLFI